MGPLAERFPLFLAVIGVSGLLSAGRPPLSPHSDLPDAWSPKDVAARSNPSVVSIVARAGSRPRPEDPDPVAEFFEAFGPDRRLQRMVGSGFVIDSAGEILTNSHVIAGAESIEVYFLGQSRQRYHAVKVGSDPLTDTAIIRVDRPPANLRAAILGDSDSLAAGDWVMAIGNPFNLDHTVTTGIVSFPQRFLQLEARRWLELIQLDAGINPGTSGGPVLNERGEVIGIATGFVDAESEGTTGIGFALPVNIVKDLLPQLRAGDVVRGQLGVQLHYQALLDDEARQLGLGSAAGALVMSVDAGSSAEQADVRPGDVIVGFEGSRVNDSRDLVSKVALLAPGTTTTLEWSRNGSRRMRRVGIERMTEATVPTNDVAAEDIHGLVLGEIPRSARQKLALPASVNGVFVFDVLANSAAEEARLQVGDVIRAIDGRVIHDAAAARNILQSATPRHSMFLLVWRPEGDHFLVLRTD